MRRNHRRIVDAAILVEIRTVIACVGSVATPATYIYRREHYEDCKLCAEIRLSQVWD